MPFKSAKQRKAFFASKGNPRSDVTPRFFIVTGKLKGVKTTSVIETTSSNKTLKRAAGVPIKLKRISKGRATQLIRKRLKQGFIAPPTKRLGKGRIRQIVLKKGS